MYGGRYGSGTSAVGGILPVTMRAQPTASYSSVRTTTGLSAYVSATQVQYIMTHTSGFVSGLTAEAEL